MKWSTATVLLVIVAAATYLGITNPDVLKFIIEKAAGVMPSWH